METERFTCTTDPFYDNDYHDTIETVYICIAGVPERHVLRGLEHWYGDTPMCGGAWSPQPR